jgi:hypothetical protein
LQRLVLGGPVVSRQTVEYKEIAVFFEDRVELFGHVDGPHVQLRELVGPH